MAKEARDKSEDLDMQCSVCGERACYIFRGKDYCDKHLDEALEEFRLDKEKKNG